MNSAQHTYELAISKAQLKDHIESFLRASGMIQDHENILTMDFKGLHLDGPTDNAIPMTIGMRKEERRVLIEH